MKNGGCGGQDYNGVIITEGLKRRIKRLSNFVTVLSERVTKNSGIDRDRREEIEYVTVRSP
jgi:hypothetical protein